MKLKIGNLTLDNRIIVGPMAGITNQAFRCVMKEFNPALQVSEMISDKAIVYKNKQTLKMCEICEQEKPVALQLFGHDIASMVQAAQYLDNQTECEIIDINMGCPVNKVVKNKAGSALLLEPEFSYELVKEIKTNITKPLTVKLRSGYDKDNINVVEMAVLMEKAGVDAITVHPRTRTQFYSGEADWQLIKDVKESVSIPVIGNGDIKSVDDMQKMSELTHCDGFMVARGCLGNPWLINQLVQFDKNGTIIEGANYLQRIEQCLKHCTSLVNLYGEVNAMKQMRGLACWYVATLPRANKVKAKINNIKTQTELNTIMKEYKEAIENDNYVYFDY